MDYNELLKKNIILLIRDHKKSCDHSECGISTYMVAELLKKAGIELTKEEFAEFISHSNRLNKRVEVRNPL